eukprot:2862923-Prymnesium_polylepis.1
MAINPEGTAMATGAFDAQVKLWTAPGVLGTPRGAPPTLAVIWVRVCDARRVRHACVGTRRSPDCLLYTSDAADDM